LSEDLSEWSYREERAHSKKRHDVVSRKPGTLLYSRVTGNPFRDGKHSITVILNARYEISVFNNPFPSCGNIADREWLPREVQVLGPHYVHSVGCDKQPECGAQSWIRVEEFVGRIASVISVSDIENSLVADRLHKGFGSQFDLWIWNAYSQRGHSRIN